MKGKLSQRILSVFLSAVMLMSMMSLSVVTVNATDERVVDITIKDVYRQYKEVERAFNEINRLRGTIDLPPIGIGEQLTESAMVRAAELMIRSEPFDLMDNYYFTTGSWGEKFEEDKCYEVVMLADDEDIKDVIYKMATSADGDPAFTSDKVDEVGIGIVVKKNSPDTYYVCLRFTNEYTNHGYNNEIVDISKIPSKNELVNQDTEALFDNMIISGYDELNGKVMYPGSTADFNFTASYICEEPGTAEIIPHLAASPTGILRCGSDGKITALNKGTATVTMYIEHGTFTFQKQVTVYVTNRNVSDCTSEFQNKCTYTGNPITPEVKLFSPEGDQLVENVDYELEYEGNVEIGSAVIYVIGLGEYENSSDTLHFEIVDPPSGEIALDKYNVIVGDSVTATVTPIGGVSPYSCVVKYVAPDGTEDDPIPGDNGKYIIPTTQIGKYTVNATVTDGDGVSGTSTMDFNSYDVISASFEQDIYPVMVSKSIPVNVIVEGGIPPYKYSYKFSNGTSVTGTTDQTTVNAGTVVGQKTLIVTVKDAENHETTAETTIDVVEKINNVLLPEKTSVYTGDPIYLEATATGGVNPISIEFFLQSGTENILLESNGNKCTYVPEKAGSYKFVSIAKDIHGNQF